MRIQFSTTHLSWILQLTQETAKKTWTFWNILKLVQLLSANQLIILTKSNGLLLMTVKSISDNL